MAGRRRGRAEPRAPIAYVAPVAPAPVVIETPSAVVRTVPTPAADEIEDAEIVAAPPAPLGAAAPTVAEPPREQAATTQTAPPVAAVEPEVVEPEILDEPSAVGSFWTEASPPRVRQALKRIPVFALVQILAVIVALIIVLIWIG